MDPKLSPQFQWYTENCKFKSNKFKWYFVLQALVRLLWLREDVKQAIDSPRLHHQLYPMLLEYEYGNLDSQIVELEQLGHRTHRYSERGSIITALTRNLTGIFGNADYRKRGDVVGF